MKIEPIGFIGSHVFYTLESGHPSTTTMTKHRAFMDDVEIFTKSQLKKAILEERNACADLCVSLRNHHRLSAIVMANRIRERNDEA
jgi:hypothetical protein